MTSHANNCGAHRGESTDPHIEFAAVTGNTDKHRFVLRAVGSSASKQTSSIRKHQYRDEFSMENAYLLPETYTTQTKNL
jgi:protein involved in ribonucleotide reduction